MATTSQKDIWSSRPFRPDFIHGVAARPMNAVTTTSDVPTRSIGETIEEDQYAIHSQAQAIMGARNEQEGGGNEDVRIDEQTRAQNQLTWELARNLVGEELVLYPAIEKYLRDGKRMVEDDRKEHDTV